MPGCFVSFAQEVFALRSMSTTGKHRFFLQTTTFYATIVNTKKESEVICVRNLTVKRIKTVVGCTSKLKIYIQDPLAGELNINGVPCRKLGILKNGEENMFSIEDTEAKLFVIADQLSKDLYNEYYTIPAGAEDVVLSGKCHYNPLMGNPFRFDGMASEEVLQHRKKNSRKNIPVLVIAVIIGLLVGLLPNILDNIQADQPKTFDSDGIQITLTKEFSKLDPGNMTVCYGTKDKAVLILKEDFSLMEGLENCSVEEYYQMVARNSGLDSSILLQESEGLHYFEYFMVVNEAGDEFYYFCPVFKTSDAFWIVHFSTTAETADTYRPAFIEYAKSIAFTES